MKSLPVFACALLLHACGGSDASVAGRIGWQFDYRDWTNDSSQSDLRTCDNTPASLGDLPPYAPIESVHVLLKDPEGQVQGIDRDVNCENGDGTRFSELKGVTAQVWELTLEAKDADDNVLYRHEIAEFDLEKPRDERFILAAATGETKFVALYPSTSGACPEGATDYRLRYSVRPIVDDAVQEEAVVTGELDACDFGLSAEVYVRDIPTAPEAGFGGQYVADEVEITVEILDGSEVVYCGTSERPIRPGNDNMDQDINLSAGACG